MGPSTDPFDLIKLREGYLRRGSHHRRGGMAGPLHLALPQPFDLAGICAGLGLAAHPADVTMTLCTAMGLARREGDVFYVTEKASEFLVEGSPWDLRPYLASLKDRPTCTMMLEVLKTGVPASWGGKKDEDEWADAMLREDFADSFTAAMDTRGAYLAPHMAEAMDCQGASRLLDIAGGSGVYACAVVERHPHIQASVLERPPVDGVARRAIERRGLAGRVEVVAGDMFAQELPPGCDVHLFSNVLHDWGEKSCRELLAKSFRALEPGGRVVVHDCHLEAGKAGPLEVAQYSVLFMFLTEGKCYSLDEMEDMLRRAGFVDMRYEPTVVYRSLMTARKPL